MTNEEKQLKINKIISGLANSSIASVTTLDSILENKESCFKNPLAFTAISNLVSDDESPFRTYAIELYLESRKGHDHIKNFYNNQFPEIQNSTVVSKTGRIVLKTTLEPVQRHDNKLLDQVNSLINSYKSSSSNELTYKDYVDLTNYINTHHLYSLDSSSNADLGKFAQTILTRMEINKYSNNDIPISELLILKPELTGIERELRLFKVNGLFIIYDNSTETFYKLDTRQTPYKLEHIDKDQPIKISNKTYSPSLAGDVLNLEEILEVQPEEVLIDTEQFINFSAPQRYKLIENKLVGRGLRLVSENSLFIYVDIPKDFNKDEKALLLGRLSLWYDKIQQLNYHVLGTYENLAEYKLSIRDKDILNALVSTGFKGLDTILEINDFVLNPNKVDIDRIEDALIRKHGWIPSRSFNRQRSNSNNRINLCSFLYQVVKAIEESIDGDGSILKIAESLEKTNIRISALDSSIPFMFRGKTVMQDLTEEQKNFISGRLTLSLLESAKRINPDIDVINSEYNFEQDAKSFIQAIVNIVSTNSDKLEIDLFDLLEEIEKITYSRLFQKLSELGWRSNISNDSNGKQAISLMLVSFANAIENEMFNTIKSDSVSQPEMRKEVTSVRPEENNSEIIVDGSGISLEINATENQSNSEGILIIKDDKVLAKLFYSNIPTDDDSLVLQIILVETLKNKEEEVTINVFPGEQITLVNDILPFNLDLRFDSTSKFSEVKITAATK